MVAGCADFSVNVIKTSNFSGTKLGYLKDDEWDLAYGSGAQPRPDSPLSMASIVEGEGK